jgi:hypothetical protein
MSDVGGVDDAGAMAGIGNDVVREARLTPAERVAVVLGKGSRASGGESRGSAGNRLAASSFGT